MIHNNIEMAILVKGRPIREYNHRGQVFVEGRAGSEYEIEISNNTFGRVEVVLSVDGLSVIDGKEAGPQSDGYLIEARKSIRVPGWTLDNAQVAKFAFSSNKGSYAGQSGKDTRNNGVIGIMTFAEKYTPQQYQYTHLIGTPMPQPFVPNYVPNWGSSICNNNVGGGPKYMAQSGNIGASGVSGQSRSKAAWGASGTLQSPTVSATILDHSYVAVSASAMSYEEKTSGGILHESFDAGAIVQNSLGTAFGESTSFATTKVEFARGDMLSMLVLYYDEARGLKARGIKMEKPKKSYQRKPEAFPAMAPEGCVPPPGWKG